MLLEGTLASTCLNMATSWYMQIPAAIGLPYNAAQAVQATSAALMQNVRKGTLAHMAAKGAVGSLLRLGMASAGVDGPWRGWRRCTSSNSVIYVNNAQRLFALVMHA
jgi:hypothetical protein